MQEPQEWKDANVAGVRATGTWSALPIHSSRLTRERLTLTSLVEGTYHLPGPGGKSGNEHAEGMSAVQ